MPGIYLFERFIIFDNWVKNCQTPVLGLGLGVDFTLANNNTNPHPNFPGWDSTRGLKFGTQT